MKRPPGLRVHGGQSWISGLKLLFFFALFFSLFRLAAFALGFQPLFTPLGTFSGTLDQLGADEFDHGLLGAVALTIAQPHDARVAAGALAEASAESLEQLFYRCGRFQKRRGLAARVQRVALG